MLSIMQSGTQSVSYTHLDELDKILVSMCENNDYVLTEDAHKLVHSFLEESVAKKEENFSNGRLVRNLYDDLIMNHARRVINIVDPSKNDLSLITSDDFKTDLQLSLIHI